ncbi:sensor histidine kinase [Paenibacillus sp.]|uniref:cache domain-containing sensor histidine kinase n=1 Tax=Paenibacillus sp. TaxID=58172 RepID=UPI0028115548|nr:sensor histidine kinase [Paenibacillus sp.]
MSLRVKLFTAFFAFIIVPLVLLGILAYYFVADTIEKKYSQQAEITLRALGQNIDFVFREMDKATDSTIASTAVQDVLSSPVYSSEDVDAIKYLELNETQRNFRELLVNHPSVSYAFMYNLDNGRIVRIYSKESFSALPFEEFRQQPIYEAVVERGGLPKWVGPYEHPQLTGYEPVFTQIRVVKDIGTLRNEGMLLVQIKNSAIEGVFRYFSFNEDVYDTRYYLVNADGLVLYDSSGARNGSTLAAFADGRQGGGSAYRSDRLDFEDVDSVVSSIRLKDEDWRLLSVTPWKSLSSEITMYLRWIACIMAVSLVSALLFLAVFINRIAKTIVRIVRFMRFVERGDLALRVDEDGDDELALLSRGLNSLIARVNELLGRVKREQERKTKAEMRVLQAQIKPHFLFNTLESINALAVQNEGRKVSQMVLRLANMLRISFQDSEEIPIRREIEHLKSYLDIQRYRFADRFEYDIEAPEELMEYFIQKLTLQPLVENCIQHAFDGLDREGRIRVAIAAENDRIAITVEDDGVGMTNETLARFAYMAAEEAEAAAASTEDRVLNPERRGLGLRSVADRIRIQYGRRYGLFICSGVGQGAVIKCYIPKYGPGEGRA